MVKLITILFVNLFKPLLKAQNMIANVVSNILFPIKRDTSDLIIISKGFVKVSENLISYKWRTKLLMNSGKFENNLM